MLIPVLKRSLGTWSEKSKVIFAWNWTDETILVQGLAGSRHLVATVVWDTPSTRRSHWLNTGDGEAPWRSRGSPRHGPSGLCHSTPQSGSGKEDHLDFPRLSADGTHSCPCFGLCAGQGASDDCWVLSLSWIGQDVAGLRGGKLTGKKLRGMIDSNCLRWKELIRAAHEHQVPN